MRTCSDWPSESTSGTWSDRAVPGHGSRASCGHSQASSPIGRFSMETAERWQPYESRGSHTIRGARGGEIPRATRLPLYRRHQRLLQAGIQLGHATLTTLVARAAGRRASPTIPCAATSTARRPSTRPGLTAYHRGPSIPGQRRGAPLHAQSPRAAYRASLEAGIEFAGVDALNVAASALCRAHSFVAVPVLQQLFLPMATIRAEIECE